MLKITNVKGKLDEKDYRKLISNYTNIPIKKIKNVQILKRSIDARRDVHFLYTFLFETDHEERYVKRKNISTYKPYVYEYPVCKNKTVTIVGSGPSGLFCAYVLAHTGCTVRLIERGAPVEERVKDIEELFEKGGLKPNSNISFGEGGAGTFSDGKLTTHSKDKRIRYILETFVKHGAPDTILYDALPHIGTDYLQEVIKNIRYYLEKRDVTFHFNTTFIDMYEENGKRYVKTDKETFETDELVLALGHSARDTITHLSTKMTVEPKAFAVGVRIEHLQDTINKIQYGRYKDHPNLPPASYKFAVKTEDGRGVYSFCMCPGGIVVPSQDEDNLICVNGMSYYARDKKNANSAILVTVPVESFYQGDILDGMRYQRELEENAYDLTHGMKAPVSKVVDYLNNDITIEIGNVIPSYPLGYEFVDIHNIFNDDINSHLTEGLLLIDKKIPGFIDEDTIITGVESRSSSPVRLVRNKDMTSDYSWVYPIGEGAGYAGGIMSSALDGVKCAEMIAKKETQND